MSIKVHQQQQFQVPQGTKVYLVNPENLRHIHHSNLQQGNESVTKVVSPKTVHERKYRKRKIESVESGYEDEEDIVYSKIYGKETTTRTGRISKSRFISMTTSAVKPIQSASSSLEPSTEQGSNGKVKKREPASVFRCPICQKVYIGYSKLNLHFRKFPDHYNYYNNAGTTTSSGSVNSDSQKTVPSVIQLKKNSFIEMSRSTRLLHCETETQTEECIINSSTKVDVQVQVSTTPESEVSKILSPVPPLRELNTIKNDNYSFVSSFLPNDDSDHLCLPGSESYRPHRATAATSNDFCGQNFGSYRNIHHNDNSNTSNQIGEVNGMMGSFDNTLRHLLRHSTSSVGNTSSSRSCTSTEQLTNQTQRQNHSPLSISSSSISPSATMKHNHSGISNSEISPHHFSSSIQKRAWDLIEEKMTHQGINEILLELTETADKLAKIARDKIIPINSEEEEERLRLNSNVPIVQVDSPFLSHLLDLPFGTYMFKEDAGVRRLLPPPVSAELSLTGGEEVDVGKFLTPDLINLPHLTNIEDFDFAAICSNN